MNNDIKKIIAGILAGGALVGGGNVVVEQVNCKYTIEHEGKEICLDEEVKAVLEEQLPISKGFGGTTFNQK